MIQLDLLATMLLVACVLPVNAYVFLYAWRPWFLTRQGRALMIKAVSNAILIDMGIATALLGPDYTGRPYVRFVGFTLFAIGNWYLFIALLRSDPDHDFPPWVWSRQQDEDESPDPPTHYQP